MLMELEFSAERIRTILDSVSVHKTTLATFDA